MTQLDIYYDQMGTWQQDIQSSKLKPSNTWNIITKQQFQEMKMK